MDLQHNTAEVRHVDDEERALLAKARSAVSECAWLVGACAAEWTQRYSAGRTDADFGEHVGLSGDQVQKRRRVYETFADVRDKYPGLKWSHFYRALTWDDAPEWLQYAIDNQLDWRGMVKARRLLNGEHERIGDDPEDPGDSSPGVSGPGSETDSIDTPDRSAPPVATAGSTSSADTSDSMDRPEQIGRPTDGPSARQQTPSDTEQIEQLCRSMAESFERTFRAIDKCRDKVTGELEHIDPRVRTRLATALANLTNLQEELGLWNE